MNPCGRPITHGHTRNRRRSPEYAAWRGMKWRCACTTGSNFDNYKGRGITICDRWINDFAAFLADMGPRPLSGYSLERVDNDGNYEPSNCIWATATTQALNRRPRKWVKTHCPHGHLLEGDNLWIKPGTRKRTCIECRKAAGRAWYQRKINANV